MGNVEIPKWLKDLPLAPEFRPTDTEFADPIAYISKIEKEASAFGICKIIPPLPKPSKRYVFFNLNKSLSRCPELGDVDLSNASSSMNTGLADCGNEGGVRAVFTTRHQELGQGMKRTKGMVKEGTQLSVHKQVWQSGEIYTLEQFESKSKAFARSLLGMIKEVNPLVIEALFWKAASEKPIHVEYANDVPGSAFGEPESQFRYFHRRRRKRASYKSYRRSTESSDCLKKEMNNVNNSCNDEIKDATWKNDPSTSSGPISGSSITSSTSSLEDNLRSSKRKNVNAITDMEGTAGWKLSNSPWNLQVIARSPGSITRFMPDDIPGVTSPMIYIGMLFSWFAWHVEDHELHSMNFLHTGSPKTWYAVPGDYAFAFEEVIRTEAYGGSIDRLGALTLLGEKTTLLSPQVVVSASIPCCRLIQNPGEFVVTFPRAYHVGFSHGFNCGEAANFGTPQWLQVAKEAAVRRAAMNYLPMLSHQQLLYLLTMSFVSRVPRSLLPGARSSRLRDRLKEERELSVKKAFIQDMLKENSILSALLGKDSTYNVVIWNADLLPCASKESQLPNSVATIAEENVLHTHSEDKSNATGNDLLKEMSLYMESLNDLYVDDDDDLSCDFQVDSGTLACVACGILGFPFMCVVQPSERASIELLQGDHPLVQEGSMVEKFDNCHSSAACDGSIKCSVPDNLHPVSDLFLPLTNLPMPRGWNNSSKFLRPRIFCLEHGVQIEEMLQSKGGANMLVICHSDYQKIKAHAAAISEDIGTPFNYNEVLLESASQEDLNLICLAIDNEDHDESGQEWTSKMGINLRFCLKVRKNTPSSKAQHALALGGLFSDGSTSDFLNIKWQSRRSRSRTKLNWPAHCKPCQNVEPNKNDALGKRSGRVNIEKGQKLIQYTRRKYKVKIDCSSNWSQCCPGNHVVEEVSVANCEDLVKHTGKTCKIGPTVEISGRDSAGLDFSPLGTSGVLHEVKVLEATGNMSLNSAPLHVAGSLLTANVAVEHTEKVENQTLEESNGYEIVCNTAACGNLEMQHKEKVTGGTSEVEDSNAIECRSPCVVTDDKRSGVQEEHQIMEKNNLRNETYNMVSEGQHKFLASRDVLENEVTDLATAASVHACAPVGQMENLVVEQSSMNCEVCDCATLDNEVQVALQTTGKSTGSRSILYDDTPINQLGASVEEMAEFSQGTCFSKDKCYGFNKLQHEVQFTGGTNVEELIPFNARLVNHPNQVSEDEFSEIFRDPCDSVKLWDGATSENVVQQAIQATNESKAEHISFSVAQMEIDQPTIASTEGFPEVIGRITASKDLCTTTMSSSDSKKVLKIPTANTSSVEELVLHSPTQMQDTSNMEDPAEEYSEAPREKYASEDTVGVNLDTEVQQEIHSDDGMNKDDEGPQICETTSAIDKEEHLSGRVTQINQSNPDPFTKCSTTDEESCTEENMLKGQEVCSSCEQESIKSTVVEVEPGSTAGKGRKRKNEVDQLTDKKLNCNGFIKSPCEGLRPRARKDARSRNGINIRKSALDNPPRKKARKPSDVSGPCTKKEEITKRSHKCDLEGCTMSFETKAELQLHKRNQCPYEGCRKRFSTHKYAIIHQRVHEGDRPLKCPWNGCSMSFKWAWARTEHIRVHTGEKPYKCKVEGCGLSFRFVSDFSRHRRKTGHYVNTPA